VPCFRPFDKEPMVQPALGGTTYKNLFSRRKRQNRKSSMFQLLWNNLHSPSYKSLAKRQRGICHRGRISSSPADRRPRTCVRSIPWPNPPRTNLYVLACKTRTHFVSWSVIGSMASCPWFDRGKSITRSIQKMDNCSVGGGISFSSPLGAYRSGLAALHMGQCATYVLLRGGLETDSLK
jgi:hypothetical protein